MAAAHRNTVCTFLCWSFGVLVFVTVMNLTAIMLCEMLDLDESAFAGSMLGTSPHHTLAALAVLNIMVGIGSLAGFVLFLAWAARD